MMSSETEADLLSRCLAGESRAWDELLDQYYPGAGRFVFQLAPDFTHEDVEEVCQEVFLTVVKCLHTFKRQSQFQTWLFRIAANKAKDYRERQRAAKRGGGQIPISLQMEDPETGLVVDPPSAAASPDAVLMGQEQMLAIREALDRLEIPCREIIELRYFADLSYDEISRALNLNIKTVSSRLSKCLDRLEQIVRSYPEKEKSAPFSV